VISNETCNVVIVYTLRSIASLFISGFRGGEYENDSLLEYSAV
jgi:hypothetical protein